MLMKEDSLKEKNINTITDMSNGKDDKRYMVGVLYILERMINTLYDTLYVKEFYNNKTLRRIERIRIELVKLKEDINE